MRPSLEQRFHESYVREPMSGCWLWTKSDNGHYGLLSRDGKQQRAHRISYDLHVGPIPDGLVVMHICDNTLCVNPNHLRVGTQLENIKDRDVKGRQVPNHPKGEANGMRKLSEADVLSIRRLSSTGWTMKSIAERFEISRSTVSFIASKKRWSHI